MIKTNQKLDQEFYKICQKFIKVSEKELIKKHQYLLELTKQNNSQTLYGQYYIEELLRCNYGYNHPIEITPAIYSFFNSTYFSNYYKQVLKEKFINKENTSEAIKILSSDTKLTDLTGKEIALIYHELLKNDVEGMLDYYSTQVLALTFFLDSKGATDFLNKEVSPLVVIKRIIATSGLCNSPEFYSGRGACISDLSGSQLVAIFNKLEKLDDKKALAMLKMTMKAPTLGATEFIHSLFRLAMNEYNLDESVISTNNFDLGQNTYSKQIYALGLGIMGSSCIKPNKDDTELIKIDFLSKLSPEWKKESTKIRKEIIEEKYNLAPHTKKIRPNPLSNK